MTNTFQQRSGLTAIGRGTRSAHPRLLLWLATIAALSGAARADSGDQSTCPADSRPSVELAPAALMSSPLHQVAPCAVIDGHLARFVLQTSWGELDAVGTEALELRIHELSALAELDQVSAPGVAARSAGASVGAMVGTVTRVVGSPIETAKRLPGGVVDYVGRKLGEIGDDARELGDEGYDAVSGRERSLPNSVRPGVEVTPPEDPGDDAWWRRGGNVVGRFALRQVGYDSARRRLAKQFEIDPYTNNPILRERLSDLAWGATVGEQAVGLGLGEAGNAARELIGGARRIDRIVWEQSPADIAKFNRERLKGLGCEDAESRRFLRNRAFSPTVQVQLVDALVRLRPARGCTALIATAERIEAPVDARFLAQALGVMVADLERRGSAADPTGGELVLVGNTPVYRSHDGGLLLALPVDWLEWSPEVGDWFDNPSLRVVHKTALIRGQISPLAMRNLVRRGWEVALVR